MRESKPIDEIEMYVDDIRDTVENVNTDAELDDIEYMVHMIRLEIEEVRDG